MISDDLKQTLRNWLATALVGILVLAVLVGAWVIAGQPSSLGSNALVARVHDANGATHDLPLSTPATLEVATSLGTNTVVVQDGAAHISAADCPGLDCTRQQPISQPGQQLICMPHRLWVEVVEQNGQDGELDAASVRYEATTETDLVSR